MDVFAIKLSVVQILQCIHGLVVVGHVDKGEVFDHSALCDCAVLLEEGEQFTVAPLLHVRHMEFDWALVLAMAGLHVYGCPMQHVVVQALDGFGGGLAVLHVDERKVFDDGTFRDGAMLLE